MAMIASHAAAEARWSPFIWVAVARPELTSNRAAILLPVQLDGEACMMQLDTGAGSSVLYRHALPKHYPVAGAELVVEQFGLGVTMARREFKLLYDDAPDQRETGCRMQGGRRHVGTIGNDAFLNGSLTLDLRNARFGFTHVAVPPDAGLPFTLMTAGNGDGKVPVIEGTLADGRHVPLLFDTGSAPMALGVFRQADWLALVGPEGAGKATRFSITAWGKPLDCRVAPILHALRIGPIVLDARSHATFCVSDNVPIFAGLAQFGLVGLVPFRDKVITLDYVQKRMSIDVAPVN